MLFVGKREPQQRDLMTRPYGRFVHLPVHAARRGHDVAVLLASHKGTAATALERDGVRWATYDARADPLRVLAWMEAKAREFKPDWIVGVSDAWYGWIAHRLARRTGGRFAVDAYDNYESYMPWNLPLHLAWRNALRAADVVTAAGPQLAELLQQSRGRRRPIDVVPMAADPAFVPRDRRSARAMLDLPQDVPLIGYSGSWAANRGTDVLLAAFALVRAIRPDARLVLTGRPPAHALAAHGVLALGYVDDAKLPYVLSALDIACVITADSAFGRYSYPAKLCEAMACGVPIVATRSEPVCWMLDDDPRFLASTNDAEGLAQKIVDNLSMGRVAYATLPTWDASSDFLLSALTVGNRNT